MSLTATPPAKAMPRLTIPAPSSCSFGLADSESVTPEMSSPLSPSWPPLGALLPELAARASHGSASDGQAAGVDEEHDESEQKLRMAAYVGQMLLERNDKQEQKICRLQTFIEETLEENRVLQQELQASKDNYRTLEAERNFLDASLADAESHGQAQVTRRVSMEAKEAETARALKNLATKYEEQEHELASLRELHQKLANDRRASREGRKQESARQSPMVTRGSPQFRAPHKPGGDGGEEDPWSVVSELKSRLGEQARVSQERDQALRLELAQSEAERAAVQKKLTATQQAVRHSFQRTSLGSEETDGDAPASGFEPANPDDDNAMMSLPVGSRSTQLSRSQSHRYEKKSAVRRTLFSEASTPNEPTTPTGAGNNASVWSEVAQENKGLQNRYEKLLRSFHKPSDPAKEKEVSSTYSGMFDELFGMLRHLKSRLVPDLTASSDSPLDMSADFLVQM